MQDIPFIQLIGYRLIMEGTNVMIIHVNLIFILDMECKTPQHSAYSDKKFYANCQKLTEIPPQIPYDAMYIYITYNPITKLKKNKFGTLGNCQDVQLNNNHLRTIEAGSFLGLSRVKTLNLQNNSLTYLQTGCFEGLNEIQSISLEHNKISQSEFGVFELGSLINLYLSHNQISQLLPGVLNGMSALSQLWLDYNELRTLKWTIIDPEWRSSSGYQLKLQGNQIQCDSLLCWLKLGQDQGLLNWHSNSLYYTPECMNTTTVWADMDLHCGQIGEN